MPENRSPRKMELQFDGKASRIYDMMLEKNLGSDRVSTKEKRYGFLASLGLCVLFLAATLSLYGIVPKQYQAGPTAGSDAESESIFIGRELLQTVPVDNPIVGMTLFFSKPAGQGADTVRIAVSGQESGQVYYDGVISLAELPESGEAALPFLRTAEAGQDAFLEVRVTSAEPADFGILCSAKDPLHYGALTADGVLSESSLVYRRTLLRDYWTWRRTMPLPYAIVCLLLVKLAFLAKAWYEKKSGKTVPFPRNEKWWQRVVCGGFLLACGIFFLRNAVYLGVACAKPECYSQVRRISAFSYGVMALMNLAVTGLVSYIVLKSPSVERIAAVSVLVLGLFYMVAITPLSPPDEGYHYQSSYKLSNYLIFRWDRPEMGNSAHFDYSELAPHENASSAYLRIMTEGLSSGDQGEETLIPKPRSGLSYSIEYLPQAIGLALGRILNLNFLGIFYLGRLTNLAFFAVCAYFAVKRIPRFKVLMALAALLPMTLQQAASYSYDAFINGMAFLFIASLIREYTAEGKMTGKDFLWLLIPGALLTPAKVVYSTMLFLTFLIPARRFGSGKRKWGMIAFAAAICLGALVAFNFTSLYNRVMSAFPGHEIQSAITGEAYYSVNDILRDPLEILRIFWRTLRNDLLLWMWCIIGYALSGLSLPIPMLYVYGFAGLLVLSVALRGQEEVKILPGQRAAFVGCFAAVVLLTMFAMLIGWTTAGDSVVQGVQGRYFLPVLPLLGMAFSGNIRWKPAWIEKALLCCGLGIHVYTVLWVFTRTIAY